MPSLYSRHGVFVCPDFDVMTSVVMIALLRVCPAPGESKPCIPVRYRAYEVEELQRYTTDKNQAFHCMMSWQTTC
jgi:hypothetical protein